MLIHLLFRTLLTSAVLLLSAAALQAATKPNFIVIFCDNLGYGDIEPFGSTIHRTPNLNRMAREGRKFTHFCVTAGVCTPSRASLMTGCYAQRVGMHDNPRDGLVLRPVSPYGLHPQEVTIAEVLRSLGYKTGIIGKWHLGDQPEFLPTRQGFDFFFGIPYSDDMTQEVGRRIAPRLDGNAWPPLPLMEHETVVEAPVDRNSLTKRYTQQALEFIEQNQAGPFFLYLPHAMPGSTSTPFTAPEFQGRSRNGPWGDSVEELDWSIGQILDKLVELDIDQQTLVVWTSDNGSPMARDMKALSRGTNRPLAGRGYTTAEGAFRVPTMMWQPGRIPAASTCQELATTMDLLPTFAHLAGGDPPPNRTIDGRDIRELIHGVKDAPTPHEAFFYYDRDQLQAVRSGPWKLFLPLTGFDKHPHFRTDDLALHSGATPPLLFNVIDDVGSVNNVADQHPDVVKRLQQLAESIRKSLGDRNRLGTEQRPPGYVANPTPRTEPGAD